MAVQNTQNASGDGDTGVVQFRIERGAEAMASDGRIGIVEQIVVDRTNGQLLALVIRGEETNTEFEMPASHVLRATGNHVYLDISRTELMSHPEMTTPYDPEQYVPVYQGDAMPPGVASRVAAEHEKPVITDVEENAARLVAPDSGPIRRVDERAAASLASSTTWTPGEEAVSEADTVPTVKLSRAGEAGQTPTDWDEAVGAEERPVPEPQPSATPETTGPLMGGKPSTGGMGTASSVPRETDPALDTVPTSSNLPPYTTEHEAEAQPPTPNLAPESDEAPTKGTTNASTSPQSLPLTQAAVAPEATTSIPLEGPEPEALLPAPPPLRMTAPARQLANLRDHLPDLLLNMARAPELWILGGSLGAGIIGGIVMRRRGVASSTATTARQAKGAAGSMLDQAQNRLHEAQSRTGSKTSNITDKTGDRLNQAKRNTDRTRQQAKKAARRSARRGRWFRRGLLLGGASAVLFAPRRGEETRTQLRSTWERLRSRSA